MRLSEILLAVGIAREAVSLGLFLASALFMPQELPVAAVGLGIVTAAFAVNWTFS